MSEPVPDRTSTPWTGPPGALVWRLSIELEAVDGGLRMDAVMYMQAALDRFAKLDQAKVGQIVMEIALLGRNGLEINKPAVRYTLKNLEGEFSGLALLAFGSELDDHFQPEMDVLVLRHLVTLLALVLPAYVNA